MNNVYSEAHDEDTKVWFVPHRSYFELSLLHIHSYIRYLHT